MISHLSLHPINPYTYNYTFPIYIHIYLPHLYIYLPHLYIYLPHLYLPHLYPLSLQATGTGTDEYDVEFIIYEKSAASTTTHEGKETTSGATKKTIIERVLRRDMVAPHLDGELIAAMQEKATLDAKAVAHAASAARRKQQQSLPQGGSGQIVALSPRALGDDITTPQHRATTTYTQTHISQPTVNDNDI